MKKKYLLLTDTHLGAHKSSDIWHDCALKLAQSIADDCQRRNIKDIIHLGDWFDDRKSLNIKTLTISMEIMKIWSKFNINIIIGNHDTYFKNINKPTSLNIFEEHQNVRIIDEPTEIDDGLLLVGWNQLNKALLLYKEWKTLLGHFEINSFNASSNYVYMKGQWNPEDFENFEVVLSGHFHIPMKKENIMYLGSPYHLSFSDINSERGYYIMGDDRLEFVRFDDYPKYVVLKSEEEIDSKKITGNIVKIVFEKDYGTNKNNKIIEDIQVHNPLQLHTDFSRIALIEDKVTDFDETESIKMKDHKDILFDYIEKIDVPDHIKKGTLKVMINRLLENK